ncbi:xaa-Arg dipeptidase-like, partial [Hemicordylus capensis]|uniref:xaa-Arg dipeptidase-like n=1 Tax=Hemicordylus capensis TaxID=884348 RepID=UPI0023045293
IHASRYANSAEAARLSRAGFALRIILPTESPLTRPLESALESGGMALRLEELKRRAAECIEASSESLGALSRQIWSQPELAYEEHQAHGAMTRFFAGRPAGSSSSPPAAGAWSVQPRYKLETAFRADWQWDGAPATRASAAPPRGVEESGQSPPPPLRLGFLCEYDALPGIGHACGHNLIAEVGAAAALGLKGALESLRQPPAGLPRAPAVKISVLGTPAEEGGAGKAKMIEAGAFDNLDIVFMAHPFQVDLSYKPDMTDCLVTVRYYGKASHAATYPWEGVNALDAAILAYNNLSVLRQQMKPTWRVHGIIKKGGERPNIIPPYTELEFYLRTPLLKELPILTEKAESCLKAAALATGCKIELRHDNPDYYNVLQNKCLEQAFVENGKSLGMEFSDDPVLFSSSALTDFGNVSHIAPGIHPYFYIGSNALNHTEQFTEAAGSEAAQPYALRTAKALAMTALDIVFTPGLLEQVREDFRHVKQHEQEH